MTEDLISILKLPIRAIRYQPCARLSWVSTRAYMLIYTSWSHLQLFVYVCVCTQTHYYICAWRGWTYKNTYIWMYVFVCLCMCVCVCVCIYIYIYVCVCVCLCVHRCVCVIYIYIYIYISCQLKKQIWMT